MTWKIKALGGDLAAQEINIERDLLVGRHQAADIVLAQADISRKHAAFLLKEQALWVQDLGSSNGTFVNDTRLATEEVELHAGDVVQFASATKFTVVAVAASVDAQVTPLRQPAEAVAVSELSIQPEPTVAPVVEEVKTAAQQLSDQGMTQLGERDSNVQLNRDGMPQNVSVPKPAPIPEGVDISAVTPEPKPIPVEQPITRAEEEKLEQKNASLGLMSLIVLIILALVAWFIFK